MCHAESAIASSTLKIYSSNVIIHAYIIKM